MIHINLFFAAITSIFMVMGSVQSGTNGLKIGFSGSLSGHFGSYGTMITRGMQAAFKTHPYKINGNKNYIELVCSDDKGDATKTKENIQTMQKQGITIFAGIMGTRGVLSILPDLKAHKLAVLFPWGTHTTLQDPNLTSIINALGLMAPQVEHLAKAIVKEKQLSRVAIFHADDDFSTQAAEMCSKALAQLGQAPLSVAGYNRYTFDLESAVSKIYEQNPRVIICISASMPAVKIINHLFTKGRYGTLFYGVDSTFLVPTILESKGVSFTYSSAVPNPIHCDMPIALQYIKDLALHFPDEAPSVLSFAYYMCARLIIAAINHSNAISKDAILIALSNMQEYNLEGFTVSFNKENRFLFGQKTWLIRQ